MTFNNTQGSSNQQHTEGQGLGGPGQVNEAAAMGVSELKPHGLRPTAPSYMLHLNNYRPST